MTLYRRLTMLGFNGSQWHYYYVTKIEPTLEFASRHSILAFLSFRRLCFIGHSCTCLNMFGEMKYLKENGLTKRYLSSLKKKSIKKCLWLMESNGKFFQRIEFSKNSLMKEKIVFVYFVLLHVFFHPTEL